MKIPKSIRDIYDDLQSPYTLLRNKVDDELRNTLPEQWHYVSRIKKPESFALKIESGRYGSIDDFDDYFACTIVVENISGINKAKEIILKRFPLQHKKPKSEGFTHKHSDSFPFDDLRLYINWKDKAGSKPTGLNGLLFEVQIKTFLQHAWSIATHDLVYKSDEVNWSKERIAYQIKAMLEHAEVSIFEADQLSKSPAIYNSNKETKQITKIIKVLKGLWAPTALPQNLKLLASNINIILRKFKLSADDLKRMLETDTEENLGIKALNLSPYAIVVQALLNQYPSMVMEQLSEEDNYFSLFIHKEIEIPSQIDISTINNHITF